MEPKFLSVNARQLADLQDAGVNVGTDLGSHATVEGSYRYTNNDLRHDRPEGPTIFKVPEVRMSFRQIPHFGRTIFDAGYRERRQTGPFLSTIGAGTDKIVKIPYADVSIPFGTTLLSLGYEHRFNEFDEPVGALGRAARSWRSRGFGRSGRSGRAPRSDRSPAAFSAASTWISAFFPTLAGSGPDPAFATLRDWSERSLFSGLWVGLPTSASRSCGLATSPSRSRASARSRAGGAAAGGSGHETCGGAVTGGALRVGGAGGPVAGGGAISTGGATATTLRISVRTVRRSPRWLAGRGSTFAAGCGRGEAGGAPTTARPPSASVVARAGSAVAIVESAAGRAVSTRARSARIREVSAPAPARRR